MSEQTDQIKTEFANLHQALTAATDTLNDAVTKSQDAVGPIATPREP